jgi:TorA maturation chaperone TorD
MKILDKNEPEWKTVLLGESLVFELAGRLLQTKLNKAWLENLLAEDIFEDVPFGAEQDEMKLGLELLQKWNTGRQIEPAHAWFESLNVDHTRLFIGAGKPLAPPWESVHLSKDRMLFQEQTLQVRNWYRRFGVETEKIYQEPDDHIGLEMLFVAHLARLGLEALEQQNQNRFDECLLAQQQFLAEHPLKWVSLWSALVQKHAKVDFYRGLAHLTHGAVLGAARMLNIKTPEEKLD